MMSLLSWSHSTHKVTVILRENQMGERGRLIPVEKERVTVYGRLQQSTVDDVQTVAASGDTAVMNLQRFYCRSFPGDDLSQVIDEEGVLYNVVGEPKRHRGSRRTQRDVVQLRQAGVKRGQRRG